MISKKYEPLTGGDATYVQNLRRKLLKLGYKVKIVTTKPKVKYREDHSIIRVGLPISNEELEYINIKRIIFILKSIDIIYKIANKYKKRKVKLVIHSHAFDPGLIGGIISLITGIPHINTVHGLPRATNPARMFIYLTLEMLVFLLCKLNPKNQVIVLNQVEKERIKRLGFPENRTHVIPNGIDLERYPKEMPNEDFKNYVLFVGRMVYYKGIKTLLNAASILQKRNEEIKIIIIGGNGRALQKYVAMAKKKKLSNIIFLGEIKGHKLWKLYSNAVAVVLPSIYEGCPTVALEAMYFGKPIIASNIPELRELIRDGETGILFEAGNPYDLSSKIILVFENPKIRRIAKIKGREFALKFDWNIIANKIVKVYYKSRGEGFE